MLEAVNVNKHMDLMLDRIYIQVMNIFSYIEIAHILNFLNLNTFICTALSETHLHILDCHVFLSVDLIYSLCLLKLPSNIGKYRYTAAQFAPSKLVL